MSNPREARGIEVAPIAPPLEAPPDDLTVHTPPPPSRPVDDAARPALSSFMTEHPQRGRGRLGTLLSRNTDGALVRKQGVTEESGVPSDRGMDEDAAAPAPAPATRSRPGRFSRHTTKFGGGLQGRTESSGIADAKLGPYPGFSLSNDQFRARGRVSKRDGRLNISMHETANTGYLAKALGATIRQHSGFGRHEDARNGDAERSQMRKEDALKRAEAGAAVAATDVHLPKLNIVIMVIGSRGDIQPFLKIGKVLKERYGHRVRIATHPAFRDFVQKDTDLEFFSVGGDPAELMAFMVKNPGLIPSMAAVRAGEIGKKRDDMYQMFQGFWRACINATDDEKNVDNLRMLGENHPFVADAIIANPPCFAHVHCAERLGVPLHLMFTFPQTPTTEFPNPLANVKRTNVDVPYTNFMSYPLVEVITWQGLGDLINRFRVKTLGLEPVSTLWAPGQLYRQKVPFTYLWSPGLVPKPQDWGPEIDIAGFVFLDLATTFKPPEGLVEFLEAGPPPIYIGFGSIVVDDPDRFTAMIFEAVKIAGVRALVSKGWGGLGGGNVPDGVYMLDNTPHDWIFPRVSAVIHHGGAGTSAIGLKCGKPTMIVPFFGDQPFWGAMIAKAGAGYHEPVPYKVLTVDKLVEGIQECLSPEAQENAKRLADEIAAEGDGAENAVESFHRSLPLRGAHCMHCSILEDRVAVWKYKGTSLKLSALAAHMLVERQRLVWRNLRLLRHYEWTDFSGPGEPVTGAGAAIIGSVSGVAKGVGGVPVKMVKRIRRHEQAKTDHHLKEAQRKAAKEGSAPEIANNGNQNGRLTSHDNRSSDSLSSVSDGEQVAQDIVKDIGKGLEKSGEVLAKVPMDISLAVAQGFHNAPRLYGDTTVRAPKRISGFRSGVRAAGQEFVYGIYDGVTGLVVHPYMGARDEGPVGLIKGVGKGVGGFVLKDLAAIIGPFGYTLKGIHKEFQKGKQPTKFIRRARTVQGRNEAKSLSPEEAESIWQALDRGWKVFREFQKFVGKKKDQGVRGRVEYLRERKKWQEYEAFESVEQAEKLLQARKRGEDVDEVFRKRKQELHSVDLPRESVMVDQKGADAHGDPKV